jgi:hypothetical protein
MTYIIENNEDFKIAEVEAPESAKLSDVQKIDNITITIFSLQLSANHSAK